MTPTEQDNELEAELDKIFPCDCSFMKGFAFRPGDPCDGSCVNAPYRKAVMQLITADRKRAELEARLDENNMYIRELTRHYFPSSPSEPHIPLVQFHERIAELKAEHNKLKEEL